MGQVINYIKDISSVAKTKGIDELSTLSDLQLEFDTLYQFLLASAESIKDNIKELNNLLSPANLPPNKTIDTVINGNDVSEDAMGNKIEGPNLKTGKSKAIKNKEQVRFLANTYILFGKKELTTIPFIYKEIEKQEKQMKKFAKDNPSGSRINAQQFLDFQNNIQSNPTVTSVLDNTEKIDKVVGKLQTI